VGTWGSSAMRLSENTARMRTLPPATVPSVPALRRRRCPACRSGR
jgi:hypothetical protein